MELRTIQILVAGAVVLTGTILYMRHLRAEPSQDEQVLAQLKSAGSDLSKPHTIQFYLYFPSKEVADSMVVNIQSLGLDIVRVDRAAMGNSWLLLASKVVVPTQATVAKLSGELDALAVSGKGEYDGWEAEVVR